MSTFQTCSLTSEISLFRGFCFKKKSSSGVSKVEVPQKVTGANVLANRSVNIPRSCEVTKTPVTFSQKPERAAPKVNFFAAPSRPKTNTVNPLVNPFAVNKTPPVQSTIKDLSKSAALPKDQTVSETKWHLPTLLQRMGWFGWFWNPSQGKSSVPTYKDLYKKAKCIGPEHPQIPLVQ